MLKPFIFYITQMSLGKVLRCRYEPIGLGWNDTFQKQIKKGETTAGPFVRVYTQNKTVIIDTDKKLHG